MIWVSLATAVNRISFLGNSIFLARVLGKCSFGEFTMARSTLGLFQLLSGFGLSPTATKFVSQYRETKRDRAEAIITFTTFSVSVTSFLFGISLFLFSSPISIKALKNPGLAPLLRIGAFIIFLGGIPGILNGILLGLEAFKTYAFLGMFSSILLLVFPVLGAMLLGLKGAFYGFLSMVFTLLFAGFFLFKKEIGKAGLRFPVKGAWKEAHILFGFSLPVLLSSGILIISTWVLNALLAQREGGYAQMGLLAAAVSWRGPLIFIPGVLSNSFFPILSNFLGNSDFRRFKKALLLQVATIAVTTSIGVLLVVFFSPFLMGLFGKTFKGSSSILNWMALSAIPMGITMAFDKIFQALGHTWLGLATSLAWAGLLIGLSSVYLGQGKGAEGIARAFCIAYTCHVTWQGIIVFFLLKGVGKGGKSVPQRTPY